MGQECKPDAPINGWTVGTLREHVAAMLEERRSMVIAMLDERRDTVMALLNERDRRLEERFTAQKDALAQATTNLDSYKTTANEFRATIADNNRRFATREEWSSGHSSLIDRVDTEARFLTQRMDNMDKLRNGIDVRLVTIESRVGYMSLTNFLSVLAILISIATIVTNALHFWPHSQ